MTKLTDPLSQPALDDAAQIAKVIRDETLAFQREDYEAWQDFWAHDEATRDVFISSTAGLSVQSGWPAIAAHMKRVFDDNLNSKIVEFGQDNVQITATGDTAWAVFNTWAVFGNGDRGESFDTRILERRDGSWKIVYASFVLRQNDGPNGLVVGLDGKGYLVQSTPSGLEGLKTHPYLTVSSGRIRAHRRDWDKALQRAVAQAGHHHGFFETHKFAYDTGGPAHYPVILGQTDEGGVAAVHFSIRDCVTYVWIETDHVLERRLNFAKTVFGLSDGQIRVARQIAMGENLRGAADQLNISVNTARTHLARLFEKTGVGTQAALVRLLLSVG